MTEREQLPRPIPDSAIRDLRSDVRGMVVSRGDESFDKLRMVWNGMIDRRPAVIVRALGARDVMTAVNFARANGLPVSVR
ncbi:MAG: FAD-linked oxidase, partial [Nitrososphaerales archaeon]